MIAFAALLLAAAPPEHRPPRAQPAPTPAWLAGRWAPVSDASRQDAYACDDDSARTWARDGSLYGDGDGQWQLRGNRLVEMRPDAPDGIAISTVRRLAPDRLRLTDADGEQVEWHRCR